MKQETKIKSLKRPYSRELAFLHFHEMLEVIGENMEAFGERMELMKRQMDALVEGDDNKLYSPAEVAKLLSSENSRIHKNTILRWIKEGRLAFLEGTSYKIPGRAIKDFISQNTRYKNQFF